MNYEYTENNVGEMFSKGFGIFFDNFLPVIGISLLFYLPFAYFDYKLTVEGYQVIQYIKLFQKIPPSYFTLLLVTVVLFGFQTLLVSAVLTNYIGNKVLDRQESFLQLLLRSGKKIFPLIGLSIVSSIMISIGTLLLVVPGIIIALSLSIVIPVMLLENKGIMATIKKSRELTKGAKGKIFGVLFLQSVIVGGVNVISQIITTQMASQMTEISTLYLVLFLFSILSSILSSGISGCMILSIYFSRKTVKDGLLLEQTISEYIGSDD